MTDELCLIRGGGDLATGVAWRLNRAGFPVVVTELAHPLTVRRTVALSTAVTEGSVDVEGMVGRLARRADEAVHVAFGGDVGVIVSEGLPDIGADVRDRRTPRQAQHRHLDRRRQAGRRARSGFTAGVDCHAVIETMRGPRLGRCIWDGAAAPNTGSPGSVGGRAAERVLRAPVDGATDWKVAIGDIVEDGQLLGHVAGTELVASFGGVVRGLIRDGTTVPNGLKIGDIDPRRDTDVNEISDKALAVGGGALEAVMTWSTRSR